MLDLCAVLNLKPISVGMRIPVVRIHRDPNRGFSCDNRAVFLRLTRDGRTWINETEIPAGQFVPAVAEIMENRAERVAYIVVDSDLSYGQFAQFADKVAGAAAGLHVVVLSGEIRRAFENRQREALDECDLVFPANEFAPLRTSSGSSAPPRN